MPHNHIANLLKQTIGVDAATLGRTTIANAVRQRMVACSLDDVGHYWTRLQTSEEELTQLIEQVVVPETWFFRDGEAFAAMVQHVRQEWVPAHATGRLRVLSAPCSTGEEPYSIAMALLDAGLPPMRFQVDAIDISERALALARRSLYGRNSFRGTDLSFRERYFREEKGLHRLTSMVRDSVTFRQANLVADDLLSGAASYDIIFCRNVLIYFDSPTQERVIRSLDRLLSPDGVLFVGPAETFLTRAIGFSAMDFPCAFACRRSARKPASAQPQPAFRPFTAPASRPSDPAKKPPAKVPTATPARPAPKAVAKPAPPQPSPSASPVPTKPSAAEASLAAATRLADTGHLAEAVSACETHLRDHGPSAQAYYLMALIRDMLGNVIEASRCYRKVLYLDPNHSEALLHLALLAEKQGDLAEAQRLQQRARRSEEVTR